MDIANRMREFRVQKQLTQEQLADRVKVARQTINLIEAGRYNPSLKLCLAICRELGVTLNDIFWTEEIANV